MWSSLRRLVPGLLLIALAAAALLVSDRERRGPPRTAAATAEAPSAGAPRYRLHLVQLVDAPMIADTRRGFLAGLGEAGLAQGTDYALEVSDAQGEVSALPTAFDAALAGDPDLILTITSPALQTALQKVKEKPVVFGLAIDPLLLGDRGTHETHRPNVAGVYDRAPFEEGLALVKKVVPGVRRIGTLFAPAEVNSRSFLADLETAARAAGLEVVSVPSNSPADVPQSAQALLGRGVQAVTQINDNLHDAAFPGIVAACASARVPLFGFATSQAKAGASLTLARDAFDEGREAGLVAARVLRGEAPGSIPYTLASRKVLTVNPAAARAAGIVLPPEVLEAADRSVGGFPPGKGPRKLAFVHYSDVTFSEDAENGVKAELTERGLKAGVDYRLDVTSAQGDVPTLLSLLDAACEKQAEVVLVASTPGLQAALRKVTGRPIVFGNVANPVLAGAGTSDADHLPNVAGVSGRGDFDGMARLVRECLPRAKRSGTLFTPSETNSVFNKDETGKALARVGIEQVAISVATAADVADASQALVTSGVDLVCQATSSLGDGSFAAIAKAARGQRKPLFGYQDTLVSQGAAVTYSRDYTQCGRDMVELVVRILHGARPGRIPFRTVSRTLLTVSPARAAELGFTIPPSVLARADRVVDR